MVQTILFNMDKFILEAMRRCVTVTFIPTSDGAIGVKMEQRKGFGPTVSTGSMFAIEFFADYPEGVEKSCMDELNCIFPIKKKLNG